MFYICIILAGVFSVSESLPPICCVPDQYTTLIHGFTGLVDVGDVHDVGYGYGITNGSMKVVFDGVTQRAYYYEETWKFLSIYPVLLYLNYTGIYDYKNNVQYRVYYDGTCDKYEVGFPLYKECIPWNATLLEEGMVGDMKISTYMFYDRIYDDPDQVTLSVVHSTDIPGECTPVRVTQSDSYVFDSNKDVNLSGGDVVDFDKGKVDPSVFIPPAACPKEFSKPSKKPRNKRPFFKFWNRLPGIPGLNTV